MTRALLLCEYPTLNGGEQSLLAALPGVLKSWTDVFDAPLVVHALAPAEGPLAQAFSALGVEVLPLQTHDDRQQKLAQEEIRGQIRAAAQRVQPDLVHANSLAMGRLAGPVAAELRIPSIAHLRDIVRLSDQAIADLNCNTRLLAVSAATRHYHIAQGVSAAKTSVANNGVDVARFRPQPPTGWLHAQLNLPREAILIGTVGQLVLRKGHDVLAAAAANLAERYENVHYVLAGSRYSQKPEALEYESNLRRSFAAGRLAGHAHFIGHCAHIPELLAELTLLVHPARQEPLGRVLLEAAAAGVAIVATDVGGTREILSSDAAEFVPPDDPPALAAAIARLLENESLRRERSANALSQIRAAFSAAAAARVLGWHYGGVLPRDPQEACIGVPPQSADSTTRCAHDPVFDRRGNRSLGPLK